MIRRGATYGRALPNRGPEDGVERGVAAFILCATLVWQFEFAQNERVSFIPQLMEVGIVDPNIGN
jgi:hypothetical protein